VGRLRAVIGLEVHAQLRTRTKLFCACPNEHGGEPNSRVCPVCLGLPGALPVPNREAIRLAARFALAVGADLRRRSTWARKNYFYPDLPKGYQISQFERPLALGGAVRVEPAGGAVELWPLRRLHVEEDAGKSVHEGLGDDVTGIDLNRCGAPLVEIVSEAREADPETAQRFLERLRAALRATGVSAADMENGTLRCDVNVSVHEDGAPWGTRVEVKNLNSFRAVRRALAHEFERQSALLAAGGTVVQETRLWDEARGATRAMRSKEEDRDYRYFPEPDLPELAIDDALFAEAAEAMPEPPDARRDRYAAEFGLTAADAERLALEPPLADYFERAAAASGRPRAAANWTLTELLGRLNAEKRGADACPLPPERLGAIVRMAADGTLTGPAAKEVFDAAWDGADPAEVVAARGLAALVDPAALEAAAAAALAAHPAEAERCRAGKSALVGFFVGEVVKGLRGASPRAAREVLERLLDGSR